MKHPQRREVMFSCTGTRLYIHVQISKRLHTHVFIFKFIFAHDVHAHGNIPTSLYNHYLLSLFCLSVLGSGMQRAHVSIHTCINTHIYTHMQGILDLDWSHNYNRFRFLHVLHIRCASGCAHPAGLRRHRLSNLLLQLVEPSLTTSTRGLILLLRPATRLFARGLVTSLLLLRQL